MESGESDGSAFEKGEIPAPHPDHGSCNHSGWSLVPPEFFPDPAPLRLPFCDDLICTGEPVRLLIGRAQSILYAAVYFAYGLYGMAAYALLVSFPIQIVSFLRWKKHAYRSSVELKKLTGKQRVLAVAGFTGIWVLLYLILKQAGAAYVLLDNTVTLFGICISFLQMFAFLEYTYLMIPSGLVTLALSIRMLPEHPEQIAYLIYSIYSLICVTVQLVNARKLYRLQQGGTKEEPSCE